MCDIFSSQHWRFFPNTGCKKPAVMRSHISSNFWWINHFIFNQSIIYKVYQQNTFILTVNSFCHMYLKACYTDNTLLFINGHAEKKFGRTQVSSRGKRKNEIVWSSMKWYDPLCPLNPTSPSGPPRSRVDTLETDTSRNQSLCVMDDFTAQLNQWRW